MTEVPRPLPYRDRDTTPFWEAHDRHELQFQKCTKCSHVRYPVGPLCPRCRSFDHEWITSSGRGRVYSFTAVRHQTHPAFAVPYTVVLAEMEEGPRLIAQLRAPEGTGIEIGSAVRVEWENVPGQSLPVFVLA